jgi:hypothetical protein
MRLQRHVYMCLWVSELLQSGNLRSDTCSRMTATAAGWDEICDNQRWAINYLLGGKSKLFHEPDQTSKLIQLFKKYCISLRRQAKRKETTNYILTVEQVG